MIWRKSITRNAHANGFTNCIYAECGSEIISCGYDGDVRIWHGIDDDDPTSKCLGEFVYSVAQYDERLLACTDMNVVNAYTLPELNRDGTEFRFTGPATCLKVNKKFIAAGSEDFKIQVMRRDKSEYKFELKSHAGPILHIDLNVNNKLLASSSGDGSIKIWNLDEKKEIKTITGLPKISTFEAAKCFVTPCFEPKTGDYLAYCNGKEIHILNCENWQTEKKLKSFKINDSYSCCAFSLCGKYLAAGTIYGKIVVFDFVPQNVISSSHNENAQIISTDELQEITTFAWNPKRSDEFAYCDSAGQLGMINLVKNDTEKKNTLTTNFLNSEAIEENMTEDNFTNEITFEDIDDEENDDGKNNIDYDNFIDPAENDDNNDDGVETKSQQSKSSSVERYIEKTYAQQGPFQPGASPENLEHRYLVWNGMGIVCLHKDDQGGSIDLEFHDASVHHSLHINNFLNHTMASLSENVLALAAFNSNKLICITMGAASGSREWSIDLPVTEGILAIVATNKFVAAATDQNFVRIFTGMGTQREVLSIPGPVVAMSGHEDKLMIVYHSAPASADKQYMSVMQVQIIGLTLRSRDIHVPLLPGRKLAWIGYSDHGSPVCYDTGGLLHMYNKKANCWFPICDTTIHKRGALDNFYIIDVSETGQNIQTVLCHGSSYPLTNPRPYVTELPMQIPLCNLETDKAISEEALIRHTNFQTDNSDKIIKENAIKLFAHACRNEMEARGKELIEMIASPQILSLAVKYASRLGRIHLADKLSELLPQIEKEEKEREKQIKEADTNLIDLIHNSSFGESLILQANKTKLLITSPKTPQQIIAPKPMKLSTNKRNPFKMNSITKTTPTASKSSSNKLNPLSHLTEQMISSHSEIDFESEHKLENQSTIEKSDNKNSTKRNFLDWFNSNKARLMQNHLNVDESELPKIALKEFRQMIAEEKREAEQEARVGVEVRDNENSKKRKLDEKSENNKRMSKLSKFRFNE